MDAATIRTQPTQAELAAAVDENLFDLFRVMHAAWTTVPSGFAFEEMRDEALLLDFKHVFVETYGIPEWAGQA